jgi:hypothetical protein
VASLALALALAELVALALSDELAWLGGGGGGGAPLTARFNRNFRVQEIAGELRRPFRPTRTASSRRGAVARKKSPRRSGGCWPGTAGLGAPAATGFAAGGQIALTRHWQTLIGCGPR